ncbi:hypothetical protein, partial [Litorivivens sp.]|uniref:hypothetical protein n=1 Tax=Litorivivens sp. TaxID=2020868 RepID=UPI00356AC445
QLIEVGHSGLAANKLYIHTVYVGRPRRDLQASNHSRNRGRNEYFLINQEWVVQGQGGKRELNWGWLKNTRYDPGFWAIKKVHRILGWNAALILRKK